MTLENIVRKKLSEAEPVKGRHHWQAEDPATGWNLYVTADRRDDLSCLVWELTLRRDLDPVGDLGSWGDRLSVRVSALAEQLQVHEIDLSRGEGVVRSARPTQRDGSVLYFEVRLQGASAATLRRYQADPTGKKRRQQIAFALTNDALARLAGEIVG